MNLLTSTKGERSVRFASTHWSVVLRCADTRENTVQRQEALEEFCQIYWAPVHAFLLRRGYPPTDAKDLTQGFFTQLLRRHDYAAADPAKGKFRTFLVTALKNFLANESAHGQAARRGGGMSFVALTPELVKQEPDAFHATGKEGLTAGDQSEQLFDQQWALALVERALALLAQELAEEGKGRFYTALEPMLGLGDSPSPAQEEVAKQLQMPVATLRTHLHRLRLRYRSILREEVARTVAKPEDTEGELRHLFQILLEY